MLVLTRKHQEKIRIGDNITITILKTKGKAVRLGIEAPIEVPVIRGELAFENQVIELSGEVSDKLEEAPRPAMREVSHADRIRDHWPTKSSSTDSTTRAPGVSDRRVSLQRVPREQVTQALPGVSADAGPLRAMLDRRSVSA
jgi:carbon storage regulator